MKEAFHRSGVRTDHGFKVLNEFEVIKQDSKHKEGNFAFWRWLISLFLNMQNLETLRSPGCSLEGLMLKLKFQYFGHLMWRVDSLEKTLMLGGIGGRRRRGRRRMRWLDGINNSMDTFESTPGVGDGQGGLACCDSWVRKVSDMTERLNWTELKEI